MPRTDAVPYCLLEAWDTGRKEWLVEPQEYESIAAATAAATDRGVYRVVLVTATQRVEMDAFAIV